VQHSCQCAGRQRREHDPEREEKTVRIEFNSGLKTGRWDQFYLGGNKEICEAVVFSLLIKVLLLYMS
jgi:hypothetical protein